MASDLERLARTPCPIASLWVSGNECFELALCPLVVEKGAAGAAEQRDKLPQEWTFVITIEQVRAARGLLDGPSLNSQSAQGFRCLQ